MATIIDSSVLEPITEQLDHVHQQTGHPLYDVFTSWLEFTVVALARDDDTYHKLVEDLSTRLDDDTGLVRDVLESYSIALGELSIAMDDTTVPGTSYPAELLGGLYEHYRATNEHFGQHFTPQSVAVAKAQMLFPSAEDVRDATPADPLTIGDPACGSGRLPFHALHRLRQISPDTPAVIVARDIDIDCAYMSVINFALCSMPAYVVHGNSLTYETWHVWQTNPVGRLFSDPDTAGIITELDPAEAPILTSDDIDSDADVASSPETIPDDQSVGNPDSTDGDDLVIDDVESSESVSLDAFSDGA